MLAVLVLLAAGSGVPRAARAAPAARAPSLRWSRPTLAIAAALLIVVAGGLIVAAFEGKPEVESPATGADPARLGSIESNRYRYWEVALDIFADHPLGGAGSGGFAVEWLKRPDRPDAARDAHSLYLETAAELGVVGVLLLVLFLGGVAAAGVRLWRIDPRAAAGPSGWSRRLGDSTPGSTGTGRCRP